MTGRSAALYYGKEELDLKREVKSVAYADENSKKENQKNDYQILHFNEKQMQKLTAGVQETLKNSQETVKPGGGLAYRFVKRAIDLILSTFALLVLSPVFLIVAAIIVIDDPGNPFFVQYRLTEKGKTFPMLKFRSMYMDAEARFEEVMKLNETDGLAFNAEELKEKLAAQNEMSGPMFKMKDDPRVTKVGKFIRKTSIDELPQLINIICGHMSIIGPRPPIPREVLNYTPYQMNRLMVKGGLACYCQCSGRSDMPFDEWVETDIQYIKERSLLVDFKILVKTFIAVLKRDGAK